MDQASKPNSQRNMPIKRHRQAFNTRINEQFGVEPHYKFRCTRQIGKLTPDGYHCTIAIGGKAISTSEMYKTKMMAATEVVKLGFKELTNIAAKEKSNPEKGQKVTGNWGKKVLNAQNDWIHASSVETVYNKIADDVMAVQFKEILEQRAVYSQTRPVYYNTQFHTKGAISGYISCATFKEERHNSLGLMLSEEQAEQSAAEVCLRSNGLLPKAESSLNYIIQPYQGGNLRKMTKGAKIQPYVFNSTVLSDMLRVYLNCHYMQSPRYYTKTLAGVIDENPEIGVNGKVRPKMDCICCFEGKVFKAKYPHVLPYIRELAAAEALKYLGISNPVEKMEIKKSVTLHRYDFAFRSPLSPFHSTPSKQMTWSSQRYCRDDGYKDLSMEEILSSRIFIPTVGNNKEYMEELVSRELLRNPSIKQQTLSSLKDLSIAEIDPDNPNLFVVGNSEFSIKMLCEGGKLYSKRREYEVDLLPGHTIVKLNCQHKLTLPSLEVYLKAVNCDDVTYPNPSLPVVKSCGTAVLFHDHEASREDVYVIVRRGATFSAFEGDSENIKLLLNKMINPKQWQDATPERCVAGIKSWQSTDVKLLSDMTMDSMQAFLSKSQKYDDRWNEIFAKKTLPDNLKELQGLCLEEIKRREEEGHVEEKVAAVTWELPESEFISRFETVGINLETSSKCAMRALVETDGNIRVKLGDFDKAPKVDVPVEGEQKEHRGDVMRYYIWKGCRKTTGDEKVMYFDQLDAEELPHHEGWRIVHRNLQNTLLETTILKDEYPHGFHSDRSRYFRGVHYEGEVDVKHIDTSENGDQTEGVEANPKDGTKRMFVGNLPPNVTIEDLVQHFTRGDTSFISDMTSKIVRHRRGFFAFAFVSVPEALYNEFSKLDFTDFDGNNLHIEEARSRSPGGKGDAVAKKDVADGEVVGETKADEEKDVQNDAVQEVGKPEAIAVDEPEPIAVDDAEPIAVDETEPIAVDETEPIAVDETEPIAVEEAEPIAVEEAEPIAVEESEPIAVDEKITDEYGTIGETAAIVVEETKEADKESEASNKKQPPSRPTRRNRRRNRSRRQAANKDDGEAVDESMTDDSFSQEEGNEEGDVKPEPGEEVVNGNADESMENGEEKTESGEEVVNGNADESMENGEEKKENDSEEKGATIRQNTSISWADDKDVKWKPKQHHRKPRNSRQPSGKFRPMPADVKRNAFREHCCWMKLDEAVGVCPMLKKISVTTEFQKQLKLLVKEANTFMESKEFSEKVKTSVLLDDDGDSECTD